MSHFMFGLQVSCLALLVVFSEEVRFIRSYSILFCLERCSFLREFQRSACLDYFFIVTRGILEHIQKQLLLISIASAFGLDGSIFLTIIYVPILLAHCWLVCADKVPSPVSPIVSSLLQVICACKETHC